MLNRTINDFDKIRIDRNYGNTETQKDLFYQAFHIIKLFQKTFKRL